MVSERPTFADRVEQLTREVADVTATAQHRAAQRRRDGRPLSPALQQRLAALADMTHAAADALAALASGPDGRRESAIAAIEEAARAGGYDLDGV